MKCVSTGNLGLGRDSDGEDDSGTHREAQCTDWAGGCKKTLWGSCDECLDNADSLCNVGVRGQGCGVPHRLFGV